MALPPPYPSVQQMIAAGIDKASRATGVIEYEHHEIHAGSHYEVVDAVDLAINNVRDIQITTPNTTKWAHFVFSLHCENETEWYLYENVTINTAGTSVTPKNNNRNSTNTSGLTVATIDNTSVANANADTAVAGATEIEHGIVAAKRQSTGAAERTREIILKQNEDYTLRIIATAAGFTSYDLEWYEHTNK